MAEFIKPLEDIVDDHCIQNSKDEKHRERILALAADPVLMGQKYHPSERMWDSVAASIISLAEKQIAHEDEVANVPAAWTPQQEAKHTARKLAFGKSGQDAPLKHRADFRRLLIEQGATPKEADAELERTAKVFGTSLASLAPGRTPKEFKRPESIADIGKPESGRESDSGKSKERKPSNGPDAELAALADAAQFSLKAQGELFRKNPVECVALLAERGLQLGQLSAAKRPGNRSSNPWSSEGWNEKEQLRITRVSPKMASDLMRAARK
jgi:hypothetical protein